MLNNTHQENANIVTFLKTFNRIMISLYIKRNIN